MMKPRFDLRPKMKLRLPKRGLPLSGFTPLEKVHLVRNYFLTGQADFNRRLSPCKVDRGLMPPVQTDRELRSLSGFTLVELMVVLSIFAVVVGIAFAALRLNGVYNDLVFIRIQLYRQNKMAHTAIIEELQKSKPSVITITDNASPVPDEIRFQIPLVNSIDANYNIPWGARYNVTDYTTYHIHYQLNGTKLTHELLDNTLAPVAGTQETKASDLIDLQFSYPAPNYISITTTTRRVPTLPTGAAEIKDSLESKIYLIN